MPLAPSGEFPLNPFWLPLSSPCPAFPRPSPPARRGAMGPWPRPARMPDFLSTAPPPPPPLPHPPPPPPPPRSHKLVMIGPRFVGGAAQLLASLPLPPSPWQPHGAAGSPGERGREGEGRGKGQPPPPCYRAPVRRPGRPATRTPHHAIRSFRDKSLSSHLTAPLVLNIAASRRPASPQAPAITLLLG